MASPCPTTKNETIILRKAVAKGIDILGTRYTYIVRSDQGFYTRVQDLEKGTDGRNGLRLLTLSLHPNCSGGDHYFGLYQNTELHVPGAEGEYESFFILKGNEYRNVRNLTTDEAPRIGTLHPKCQGGNFYMAVAKYYKLAPVSPMFIIVRESEGKFEVYEDLTTADLSTYYKHLYGEEKDGPYDLHDNCKGGLYYWATKSKTLGTMRYYILKGIGEWGIKVHCTYNLRTDFRDGHKGEDILLDRAVVEFLPRGLTIKPSGQWRKIWSFKAANVPLNSSRRESRSYNKELQVFRSLQNNLEQVSLDSTTSIEASVQRGASQQNPGDDNDLELQPGEIVYIWQYVYMQQLTTHIEYTTSITPPTYEPQMDKNSK